MLRRASFARPRMPLPEQSSTLLSCTRRENAEGTSSQADNGGFDPAIDAELAILARIDTRYSEELAKLERSPKSPDMRERLREQVGDLGLVFERDEQDTIG